MRRNSTGYAVVLLAGLACSSSVSTATDGAPGDARVACNPMGAASFLSMTGCVNCVAQNCNSQYAGCYGGDWRNGDFSGGSCGPWTQCVCGCAANDTQCMAACQLPMDCANDCGQPIDDCVSSFCSGQCT